MDYSTSQANVAYSTSDVPLEGIAQALDESEYIVVRQDTSQQLLTNEYVISHNSTGHPSIRFTENTDYANVQFRVSRVTDLESLRNTFYPGANLRSQDLNSNFQQSLQATQEVYESYLSRYGGEIEGNLSFNANVGGRLTGLQNPTVDDEAANKVYADGVRADVAADRAATLGFKNDAETASNDAQTAQNFLNGIYLGTFNSATDPAFYNTSSSSHFNPHTNTPLDADDEGAFYFNNDNKLTYVWDGSEFVEAIQPPLVPFNQTFKGTNTYTAADLFYDLTFHAAVYEIDQDAAGNALSFPTNVSKILVEVNGELIPPGAVLINRDLATGDAVSVLIQLAQPGTPLAAPQDPGGTTNFAAVDTLSNGQQFTEFLTTAQVTALTTGISSTRINIVAFGQSVFGAAGWQEATFSNGQINLISRTNPELNLTTDDLRPTLTTNGASHSSTPTLSNAGVQFDPGVNSNEYVANFTIPYARPDTFSVDSTTYFPTLGFSDGTTVTSNVSILGPAPSLFNGSAGFTVSNSTTAPGASLTQRAAPNDDEYDFSVVFPNVNIDASNVTTLGPTDSATASLIYTSANNQYELSLGLPRGHNPTFQTGTTSVEDGNNTPGISFSSAGTGSSGEPLYDINSVLPVVNFGSTVNVSTLNPGSSATASIAQDANFATNRTYNISLGIPKGDLPVFSAGTATMDSGNSFSASVGGTAANPTIDITLPRPVVFWTSTPPSTGGSHQLGVNTSTGQIYEWVSGTSTWEPRHNPAIPFTWKGRVNAYSNLPSLTTADKGDTYTVDTASNNQPADTTYYWDGSAWVVLGNLTGPEGASGNKFQPIDVTFVAAGVGTGIERYTPSGATNYHKLVSINGLPNELQEGDLGITFASGDIYRFEMIDGDTGSPTYQQNEAGVARYGTGTYFSGFSTPIGFDTANNTPSASIRAPHWVKIGTINTGMIFGALGDTAPVVTNIQNNAQAQELPVYNGETVGENTIFVQYDGYGVTYKKLIRSQYYSQGGTNWWYQWEDLNGTHWTGRGSIGIGASLPAIQTTTNTDDTAPTNYNLGSLFILTSGNTGTFYNLSTYTHANGHTAYNWVAQSATLQLGYGLPTTAGVVTTDGSTSSAINTTGIVNIDSSGTVGTLNGSGLVVQNSNVTSNVAFPSAGIVTSDGSSFSQVTNNSTNWNTAYGWGDHGLEGYYKDGSTFADYSEQLTADGVPTNNTSNKTLDNSSPMYYYVLGGNITITISLNSGESIQVALNLNGYTPTFAGVNKWVGGAAPSGLNTANNVTHVFEFWNIGTDTYGAYVGVAS